VWAVSVAAELDGDVVAGAVRAPALGLTWYAGLGEGAWLRHDGEAPMRIRVGDTRELSGALIATGFGYAAAARIRQATRLVGMVGEVRDIRRAGAAAVDLCWVADGTVDGYFEEGTHIWDRAAGGLVVTEAGGVLTGLDDEPASDHMTIAANRHLAFSLRDMVSAASSD
jgi:myo-inositol-1(or 4)-monophosphatase